MKSGTIISIRRIPYLPSLRRIPARIILPATGASTCALGSQRWVKNIGILTKNATRQKIHIVEFIEEETDAALNTRTRELLPEEELMSRIDKSKGKEAVVVYIIRYMLACRRSG